jgi:hypothetical protein
MTPRGKKLAVLVSAFCALFAIAGASSAVAQKPRAKAKVSTVNRTFVLPVNAVGFGLGQANPPCPSNRTLIGGGSRFGAGIALTTSIDLVGSGPTGDAWETVYDNNTALNQLVQSDAICLRNKLNVKGGQGQVRPRVKQVRVPLLLPGQATNFGVVEAEVECPRRHTVVSGGLRVIPGTPGTTSNEIDVFESGPNPDANSWHVRYNNDSSVGANAEASVLCLKNKTLVKKGDGVARAKVENVTRTFTLPPQTDPATAGVAQIDVACPGGTKLVGGGARFLPGTPSGTRIQLFESGPNGNSWHVRYDNDTGLAQSALAFASCLRNNLKVK